MYKILIVEDHALIRFGLKTAFESKKFINEIFEATCAEDAISIVKTQNINLVIMDLGLPSMNGIEAAKIIHNLNKNIKIIILTSHNSEQEVLDSVKAGARAYCSKDINPQMLAEIVLSVAEGALWFDPKIADIIINSISSDKTYLNCPKKFCVKECEQLYGCNTRLNNSSLNQYNFTDRELEVLDYICHGLTNSEISAKLDVSINTIKVHVSSIIQKMGVEDRTQVVVKAFNNMI